MSRNKMPKAYIKPYQYIFEQWYRDLQRIWRLFIFWKINVVYGIFHIYQPHLTPSDLRSSSLLQLSNVFRRQSFNASTLNISVLQSFNTLRLQCFKVPYFQHLYTLTLQSFIASRLQCSNASILYVMLQRFSLSMLQCFNSSILQSFIVFKSSLLQWFNTLRL